MMVQSADLCAQTPSTSLGIFEQELCGKMMIGLAESGNAKDVRIALVDIVGKYPPRFSKKMN
jgi:hypothetical protein